MGKWTFLLLLVPLAFFSEVFVPHVGVVGDAPFKDALQERLGAFYELVPVEEEDYSRILRIWKEQDIGLREKGLEEAEGLPEIDYLIALERRKVTFYDMRTALMKKHELKSEDPVSELLRFFQGFVLRFQLPSFKDKDSRPGEIYAILDSSGNVVGYYKCKCEGGIVNVPVERFENACYARKLRSALFHNGGLVYEVEEKDLNIFIIGEKFRVFKNGESVKISALLLKGGFLYVFDVYGDDILCIESNVVEKGKYDFQVEAYVGELGSGVPETLIFVLMNEPLKDVSIESFEILKGILKRAVGVDMFTFVVR